MEEKVGSSPISENGSCATSVVHIIARHVDNGGEQEPLRKCYDNPYCQSVSGKGFFVVYILHLSC